MEWFVEFPRPRYASGEEVRVGDWVTVNVPEKGGIFHDGIVYSVREVEVWDGFVDGFAVSIADNQKGVGASLRDSSEFAIWENIVLFRRAVSEKHVQQIRARVDANLGKPYNFILQNCQHFASHCFEGKPISRTVNAAAVMGLATAVVWALSQAE